MCRGEAILTSFLFIFLFVCLFVFNGGFDIFLSALSVLLSFSTYTALAPKTLVPLLESMLFERSTYNQIAENDSVTFNNNTKVT